MIILLIQIVYCYYPINITLQDTITLTYQISSNQTQIKLIFSEKLNTPDTLFDEMFALTIGSLQAYNYTIISADQIEYIIMLQFQEQFYFQQGTIRFLGPYEIRNVQNNRYLNRKYQVINFDLGPYIMQSALEYDVMFGLQLLTYSIIFVGLILYISMKKIQNSMFWLLIDSAQLLNIFYYLNSQITYQVKQQFYYLRYFNFQFGAPNVLYDDFHQTNKAQLQQIVTQQVIYNEFIQWTLIIFSLVGALVFTNSNYQIYFQFRVVLKVISVSIWSMALASFAQLDVLGFEDFIDIANISVAIFTLTFLLGYIVFYLFVSQKAKSDTSIFIKFGALFDGLQTKAFFKRNFFLFLELRKIFYPCVIVILYNYQNTSISIIVITQILYVTILSTKFPSKIRIVNLIMIWTEVGITVISILIACIIILDYVSASYINTMTRNIVGWLIIGVSQSVLLLRSIGVYFENLDKGKTLLETQAKK